MKQELREFGSRIVAQPGVTQQIKRGRAGPSCRPLMTEKWVNWGVVLSVAVITKSNYTVTMERRVEEIITVLPP